MLSIPYKLLTDDATGISAITAAGYSVVRLHIAFFNRVYTYEEPLVPFSKLVYASYTYNYVFQWNI